MASLNASRPTLTATTKTVATLLALAGIGLAVYAYCNMSFTVFAALMGARVIEGMVKGLTERR